MKKARRQSEGVRATEPGLVAAPKGCTHFKVRQLMRRVAQRYDGALAEVGLKTTQYSLLSHLLKLGPIAPGVLARRMTMDASTLTRNLKPLLEAGWVVVQPGPDGRTRTVVITEAGRSKREQAKRRWRAAQDALESDLGASRVAALHALIDESLVRLAPAPLEV